MRAPAKVPQTYNRAATALVRARRHLEQACAEVRLAFDILATPSDPFAIWPEDPDERKEVLRSLTAFLARLEATQRAAAETWGAGV